MSVRQELSDVLSTGVSNVRERIFAGVGLALVVGCALSCSSTARCEEDANCPSDARFCDRARGICTTTAADLEDAGSPALPGAGDQFELIESSFATVQPRTGEDGSGFRLLEEGFEKMPTTCSADGFCVTGGIVP